MKELEPILLANSIPEPMSGCWLWIGSLSWDGYGQFNYRRQGRGVKARAHRISYEIYNGPFDRSLSVLHRCDLPCCVNPDHLFLGTHTDNMKDMARKGRQPLGEKHHITTLSNPDVLRIRDDPRKISVIAREHGVTWSTIKNIKTRVTWGHL